MTIFSFPTGIDTLFEEFCEETNAGYECIGTGCGSSEYEVPTEHAAALLARFAQAVSNQILTSAMVPADADEE